MFCPKCAAQNADDAKFCRSCGTDISLVPQVVTGQLAARLADEDETRHGRRRHRHRGEGEPPSIERGVRSLFMGVAFIFIAFAIKTWMPGSSHWWFWLLLPSAGFLANAVSTYLRLAEERRRLAPPSHQQPAQTAFTPPRGAGALPPRDTGEILPPPPSITEGTTRHLNVPDERTRRDA